MVTGSPSSELTHLHARASSGDISPQSAVATLYVPTTPVGESLAYRFVKRAFDLVVASLAVLVFSPIMIVVAILILAEDRGPILYRQPRIGRYGVPFWFYKFRSMRIDADRVRAELLNQSDAEGAAFKMKNDPRITRIGRFIRKFSIDEMPQLFSVLAGHMCIVGPRPHLACEVSTYTPDQYARLLVRPGLLCLREIRGRSELSFAEWVRLDLEYVQQRSLWMDLKIFFLAIPAVVKGKGAY